MPQLKPSEIVGEVKAVLAKAATGRGTRPNFLTSYQILDRLTSETRTRLIKERGLGGSNAGTSYTAPKVVSRAAEMIGGVVTEYIDTGGLGIAVTGKSLTLNQVCAIYRLGKV